ncbi:SDR family NAD(P)-dependent oxidoreductase [Cellulophaga sp. Z1A5H]|uniref:SDR family NAD(P)-dependent oxidoreductase n=1 Tax=Cellulophaga sp. Z1A5H TaxID=2687291 RepID=UPI0013FD811C|nr:SDR family oxidoreductase [Cellulophaga sp. Z1A5H]
MNIFIAGGTSGIGYSLAAYYLSKGYRVGVCGRDLNKISKSNSHDLIRYEADVCVKSSVEKAVLTFLDKNENLDIFINCAGSYAEDVAGEISYEEATQMLKTNILGTINCFEIARELMVHQKLGRIAVIASVSGILDYENSSLYTKTKRAIIQISDAYHRALKPFGISVTTIAPGYIDTLKLRALNNNDLSKKPFLVPLDVATKKIMEAIDAKKKLVVFPLKMKWMMTFLSALPAPILNLIMFKKAKWMKQE